MTGGLAKRSIYLLAGASVIGLMAANAPEAKAQDMQQIQAQINEMQATIKALQKQVQDAKAQAAAASAAAADAGGSDLDLKVKWKGAPEFSSEDGKFKFKVRGRLQATTIPSIRMRISAQILSPDFRTSAPPSSAVLASAWKASCSTTSNTSSRSTSPTMRQRSGTLTSNIPACRRLSLPSSATSRRHNSLEQLTSSRFITFMERAAFVDGLWH